MNRTKFFITLIFFVTFAFQASAQEKQTPKIVWKNLRESYQSFEEVKPQILSNFGKPLYLYPTLDVQIFVFDDAAQKWDLSKYIVNTCDVGEKAPKRESLKFNPNQTIDISKWIYWNYALLGENGAFQSYYKPDWDKMPDYREGKKYKLVLTYSEKKYKDRSESESPEFWVKPNETTK